jgi:diguanylate cyclase (GGDEF)-like protein
MRQASHLGDVDIYRQLLCSIADGLLSEPLPQLRNLRNRLSELVRNAVFALLSGVGFRRAGVGWCNSGIEIQICLSGCNGRARIFLQSLMAPIYLPFAASILLALMAAISGIVWHYHRKHLNLLCLAGGLLLAGCAQAVYALWGAQAGWGEHVHMGLLSGAAAVAVAQSVAMRFGRRVQVIWVAAGAGVMAVGAWYFMLISPSAHGHWVVTALGLALILGHVLPVTWSLASRHRMERMLLLVYTAISALVLCSPWLNAEAISSQVAAWMWSLLIPLSGGLLVAAMVGCTLTDGLPVVCTGLDRDALTGLLSRRAFDAVCGSHPATQQISVLVLCDLDNFQRINNQFGTTVGNEVLRSFAQLLQSSVREGDHVARIGGEEFGMALRDIDMDNAQALIQRITHSMRQQSWGGTVANGEQLTASFGLAMVRENDSLQQGLHRADVLLCQAKDAGSNRVGVEAVAAGSAPSFG